MASRIHNEYSRDSMNNRETRPIEPIRLRWYAWGLAAAWTAAVGATLTWELFDEWNQALDVARAEARGTAKRDYGFLRWYTAEGGVYVPVGEKIQASRYMVNVPERDVVAPSGTRLTLANPTDLIRQVHEIAGEESEFRARLTRTQDIRPANAPDPWEREALEALGHGEPEAASMVTVRGESVMRLMWPLVLEPGCLKCHAEEGSHVGQPFGGISVAFRMASVWPTWRSETIRRILGYGGMGILGLVGIALRHRQLQQQIERRQQAERAVRANEAQMLAAREIQERLLPSAGPVLPGFDIAGASWPAELTSGDFFDYIPMLDEGLGFAIGDVSGHGYGPALLMASTYSLLRALAQTHREIGGLVESANRFLSQITRQESFVTLFLGRLDAHSRSLTYTSAGHPTAYVLDRSGTIKSRLESTGPVLAVVAEAAFPAGDPVVLESGDVAVLLTDGILEATSPEGLLFGEERVVEAVAASRGKAASEIVENLLRAVLDFSRRERPVDDITAIIIKTG
jgi:serine phosphatase RsbU (regulator of sigma subunit)